jgi:hypothetical protein
MSPSKENPVGDETFDYNDRYGSTPKRAWLLPAAIFAIIGLTWTLWAALDHSQPELRSTLYSFSVTGEREITMRYGIERRDLASGSYLYFTYFRILIKMSWDKLMIKSMAERKKSSAP